MRVLSSVIFCAALLTGCTYQHTDPAPPAQTARELSAPPPPPYMLYVSVASDDTHQHVALAPLDSPATARLVTELSCERAYFSGGHGICLNSTTNGPSVTHFADFFDSHFETTGHIPLTGPPSRVRVSVDGRRAAATVFEEGHSYAQEGFSTRTTVIDLLEGKVLCDLEDFTVFKDGRTIKAKDFNFWGLTFEHDGNAFYATLDTGGISYLVHGDIDRREMRVVRAGVECPSLSPDNSRLVFKKRIGSRSRGWWQLARFDVASGEETVLAKETRSVDDQVEWLDDRTVTPARASRSTSQ